MKITKFGQCCLLIETAGKRILTDPGRFSTAQNELHDIDLILITHEHADHLHTESMKAIMAHNPMAVVVTNAGVGKILDELGIVFEILTDYTEEIRAGVTVEAFPGQHVEIFGEFGQVENTGYFIENTFFYPGDAYTNPGKPVPVLALPVSGPWCALKDAVEYAISIKPTHSFPVHDAVLNDAGTSLVHGLFKTILGNHNVDFVPLGNGETKTF